MRVAIFTEGKEESQALKVLQKNLEIEETQIVKVALVNVDPKEHRKAMVRKVIKRIEEVLEEKEKPDKILFLLDRENQDEKASEIAEKIQKIFVDFGYREVEVVVKNRKFENWLIADVGALEKLKKFKVTKSFRQKVVPNKADNVDDAEKLLNSILSDNQKRYHKGRDQVEIIEKQDFTKVGCNSRSFRRFLRSLNHPQYQKQSLKPDESCEKR